MGKLTAEPSAISPDVLYHIEEAKRRLGWGSTAMRTARRKGLEVRYVSGRAYLLGEDIIKHIIKASKSSRGGS